MALKMCLPQCQRVTRSEESIRGRWAREPITPASSPPPRTPVSTKNILFGHIIYMNFLDSERFWIANLIKHMGWKFICTTEALMFKELVKKFYQNISFGEKFGVSSLVKGKIDFDNKILKKIETFNRRSTIG